MIHSTHQMSLLNQKSRIQLCGNTIVQKSLLLQTTGSSLGAILTPRVHLAVSEDILCCQDWGYMPQRRKQRITIFPAISLLGKYPRELIVGIQADICIPMFIAIFFTITKRWKNSSVHCQMNG